MLRKSQNSCGNRSIQPVPSRHFRQEPDTSWPLVSSNHPALSVAQTPPHPPTGPRGTGGRRGTRCVKPSGDAAPGTGRLRQKGGSPARFRTPEPPYPSTSRLRPAAAEASSLTLPTPPTGPTAPAQPARRHRGRGLGSGGRRRRAPARPQECRERGQASLTAAGHQHQEAGLPVQDQRGDGRDSCGASTSCLRRRTGSLTGRRGGPNSGSGGAPPFSLPSRPTSPCQPRRGAGADHRSLGFRCASRAVRSGAGMARPGPRGPPSSPAVGSGFRGPSIFPGRREP
ncbi:unnamed protein product [Rangifer tarandus platyrhynchus]|uniref:Uncharacterized protein n=2 Tax=Rangifer tarandus platyrhynchus TaxID=3082113 RepID=A0ABN8YSZ7_RANTA|nr:unnamed protein product [Rangifer tarandus platyrhynchus]CAI9702236.1 unnamed protein product [Rangifer tarandus platyrhynchus]